MLMDRTYTEKLISETEDRALIEYVNRLNETKTCYTPESERYGDAISKNEVAGIINQELNLRKIELLCFAA